MVTTPRNETRRSRFTLSSKSNQSTPPPVQQLLSRWIARVAYRIVLEVAKHVVAQNAPPLFPSLARSKGGERDSVAKSSTTPKKFTLVASWPPLFSSHPLIVTGKACLGEYVSNRAKRLGEQPTISAFRTR